MNIFEFTSLIALGSFFAGFLGSLTGLGGGVVIVPLLALLFHVDIRYAIGASLVSVIATSSRAAAAYVRLTTNCCCAVAIDGNNHNADATSTIRSEGNFA